MGIILHRNGTELMVLVFFLCILQQQRVEHLEEKLRLMTEARDEAQNCCLKQKQMVGEAQVKANQLSLHADGLRRRIEELQQVISSGAERVTVGGRINYKSCLVNCGFFFVCQDLNSKEQEKVTEVNKVKVELQEQIGHLQAERTAQEGLREKIAALERQLKGGGSFHAFPTLMCGSLHWALNRAMLTGDTGASYL